MTDPDVLACRRPLTWVFAGDSITAGVAHTHGRRSWVEHVHERIRFQLGRSRDILINSGIAGWTAPAVLADVDHLICRFAPDVVSIALGMNDSMAGSAGLAGFADALAETVQAARSGSAPGVLVVLHTPNAIGSGAWNAPGDVAQYAAAVRQTAAELETLLVDHHAHWVGTFGTADPSPWLDEPVHPNAEGHLQMANLTLSVLGAGPVEGIR
ncbi:MAG TPA: SGNH/GDSL hydrolase family protein [Dermatophilaceae bacterium]|nr:SGNH/GDSL hydrolase family protein [Dermatophilaceae bacterium]